MASIRVTHTIDDLASDMRKVATTARREMAGVVRRNVREGGRLTQRIARAASGPHGRLYYKRISSEMTGTLSGEWGPTGDVVGNAVGAGWRHGTANTDLEKSQDVIGPKAAKEAGDVLDGLFWPR